MYFCAHCRRSFKHKNEIKRHVKVHFELKFFCGLCYDDFYCENAFIRHGFTAHGKQHTDFLSFVIKCHNLIISITYFSDVPILFSRPAAKQKTAYKDPFLPD